MRETAQEDMKALKTKLTAGMRAIQEDMNAVQKDTKTVQNELRGEMKVKQDELKPDEEPCRIRLKWSKEMYENKPRIS